MKTDAVLLDLDGTLWDTVAAVTVSWQQVIDKYPGLRGPLSCAELRGCMGFNMDDIGAMIFPNVEEKRRTELLDECVAAEHAYLRQIGASLFPGVRETLPILAEKCKLAIISNCESGYIECFWEIAGLGRYFSDSECYGDTGLEKGANIRAVAERLSAERPVYVGDIRKDQLAAEEAEVPYIYAAYGFGEGRMRPTHWQAKIDSFAELADIVNK